MSQHFTQSASSRNLKLSRIARLTDEQAYQILKQVRFASSFGRPVCPYCNCERVSTFRTRRTFKCRTCKRHFSITSGTIWARRKMPYVKLMMLVAQFVLNAKGRASVEVARQVDLAPMSAFVACHKIREAMALETKDLKLKGIVEIDGCRIGGFKRLPNLKEDRDKLTWAQRKRWDKIRYVCAARVRGGPVLTRVLKSEKDFVPFVLEHVDPTAIIHSDEASHWERLGETFTVMMVNHSANYSEPGRCTNGVEGFFSRLRRAERGVYLKIADVHSDLYAVELAWRETNCRVSDAERFVRVLSLCLQHPVSRRFAGYWQRRREDV